MIQKNSSHAGFISAFSRSIKGFTLIELLVVVIIIAVLAAVAVPMYKRAVLKSRFTTVMPMAKSVADAQEVYYLGNGQYAPGIDKLDVAPIAANNTSLSLSQTDGYEYVLAQRTDIPELHYIMYQEHSENYPKEIHCEAEQDNTEANRVCGELSNNNEIGVTLTKGYKTYLIEGSGLGLSPWANAPTCDAAEAMGYTCSITTNKAGKQAKTICKTAGSFNVCRITTYNNEDGGYTSATCWASNPGGGCGYGYTIEYDNNGNMTSYRHCATFNEDRSVCESYYKGDGSDYTYDASGNMLTRRQCFSVDENGNCTVYGASENYDYTYDASGNKLSQRKCNSMDSSGNCTEYSNDYAYDYTYDANGNMLSQRYCSSVDSNGNCTAYSSSGSYDYTYDANGNQLTQRNCSSVDSNGNCTAYDTSRDNYNYTYDANGNKLTKLECSTVDSSGNCTSYEGGYKYTYNASGNMVREVKCSSVNRSGKCTAYYGSGYTYTYDTNGNLSTQKECNGVSDTGKCTSYKGAHRYVYDDNGKKMATLDCSSSVNTSTGVCTAYDHMTLLSN